MAKVGIWWIINIIDRIQPNLKYENLQFYLLIRALFFAYLHILTYLNEQSLYSSHLAVSVDLRLDFMEEEFTEDLADKNSDQFKKMETKIERQVGIFFLTCKTMEWKYIFLCFLTQFYEN